MNIPRQVKILAAFLAFHSVFALLNLISAESDVKRQRSAEIQIVQYKALLLYHSFAVLCCAQYP
jgi:hypothetical protein